jgi:drug/metabolite transporter (DMT)-like permease
MYARLKFVGVPPLVVSLASCGVAAVLTMPPALATIGGNSPDLGEIAAVVSLGVFGTAVAFVLYFGLIKEVGAGKAALCGYLIPPTALAYGALLLDEEITAASIAGLVLILAGVALASGEREGDAVQPEPFAAAGLEAKADS